MVFFYVNDNNVTNFSSLLAIASTPPSAYGQTHVIAANSNNNKNNVDFSSVSLSSTPTNVERDLAMERAITTAV